MTSEGSTTSEERGMKRAQIQDGEDQGEWTREYERWLEELERDVIQAEYGYEPGEFTVYADHWVEMYERGLTPLAAFQRALDAYADARREEEAARKANWERIQREDAAFIAASKGADQ